MKKVLILLSIILVGAAVIGPKIVGSQLEGGIRDMLSNINNSGSYTASITNIESTWFNTVADISVSMNMPETTGEESLDMSFDLVLNAQHGPIITEGGFALAWIKSHIVTKNSELPEGFVLKKARPVYEFEGLTNLFGTTRYADSIAALDYTDENNQGTLSFSGLQGEGSFSNSGIDYSAKTDLVTLSVPDTLNVKVEGLNLSMDSSDSIKTMMTQGMYNSNSNISMDLVTWNDMIDGTEVRIVDTQMLASTDYDKDTDLGGIEINTTIASTDAPNTSITDLNAIIQIKNLQAKFLLAYQDFTNSMLKNSDDPQQVGTGLDAFMDAHLLEQLQAKPEYNISKLSGKINGSVFDGKIMMKLDGITELPATLADPSFWIQHSVVDSKIVMQKNAAEFVAAQFLATQLGANPQFASMSPEQVAQIIEQQTGNTLTALVQQEMLIRNGEDYEFVFTLQGGAATINGNVVSL